MKILKSTQLKLNFPTSKLINYEIDILTDAEDSERRQKEFKERTELLVKALEVDETLGQLLVAEGYSTIDDIKDYKPVLDILKVNPETNDKMIKQTLRMTLFNNL